MRSNCISACRQSYSMRFCNCSVDFLHPSNGFPSCDVSGILCLIPYNDLLNAEKPLKANQFFSEDEEGLKCSCLPECNRVEYKIEMSPIYDEIDIDNRFVLIDVHYADSTMLKYRTDVTFSTMDLIIGFGGIVSLFLGCSLLSGVEILYFSTVGFFWHRRRTKKQGTDEAKARFPFVH